MKSLILPLLLAAHAAEAQQLTAVGRTYNPSCPGYFSQALLDAVITYAPHEAQREQIQKAVLHYSFREAWHHDSWQRPVATQVFEAGEPGLWKAEIDAVEVASRGSYTMSHLEFAIQLLLKDGSVIWDNGGRAPLGFYSAGLPAIQCEAPAYQDLTLVRKAHENDYGPAE
jgi:hypothetical protein